MDESRFDDLARGLATGPSRRSLLVTLAASALGAVVGLRGNDAIAKPKPKKPNCKSTEKPCGKVCIPKANCCNDRDCVGAATCRKGKCRCRPQCAGKACGARDRCGGFCTACPPGQSCVNKQCADDVCTPECNNKNCGDDDGCGGKCITQQGCGANEACVKGECVTPSCNPACTGGQLCCDTSGSGVLSCHDCCSDGDCAANALALSQGRTQCFFGNCACPAEEPKLCRVFGSASLHCTNPLTDKTNCSALIEDCGFACSPPDDKDRECCNGRCAFLPGCAAGSGGWSECQTTNCGECGQSCLDEGYGCCEGKCVNMVEGLDANENCGFCGANCGDLTCCGGSCVNTDNDQFNCGDCGNTCDGAHACCHGECTRLGTPENCRGCDDECEANQFCVNSTAGCAALE